MSDTLINMIWAIIFAVAGGGAGAFLLIWF